MPHCLYNLYINCFLYLNFTGCTLPLIAKIGFDPALWQSPFNYNNCGCGITDCNFQIASIFLSDVKYKERAMKRLIIPGLIITLSYLSCGIKILSLFPALIPFKHYC